VVLQTAFGAKTDPPSHRVPPLRLRQCTEEAPCPVSWWKECINRTVELRGDSVQTVTSPYRPHPPVKLATLGRWVARVLRQAGVEGSAGSRRAAVPSWAPLRDVPLQQITEAADWSGLDTLVRHSTRILPELVLRDVERKELQDAVLEELCGT